MEIQQIIGGIDFEREIKAAMRIGRVFKVGDAALFHMNEKSSRCIR